MPRELISALMVIYPGVVALMWYRPVVWWRNAEEPTTLPLRRRDETQRHHHERDN